MLTGDRFGRLTVLAIAKVKKHSVCVCLCDCGQQKVVRSSSLTAGYTRSCGCLASERISAANLKHGESRSPEWITWRSMHQRCSYPKHKSFAQYGGRGIKVARAWTGVSGFVQFLKDMGRRPSPDHSLDRINNNGPYAASNCRWATRSQQAKNRRHRPRLADGTFSPERASTH